MRSSHLAFVIVAAATIGLASTASAQVRIATGVTAGALTCTEAAEVPEGAAVCCTSDADCADLAGGESSASCVIAMGATDGVCVIARPQENGDCAEQFESADMIGPCFGAMGHEDGDCDEDGVLNIADNCRCTANEDQRDCDADGVGAQCEAAPNPSLRIPREACDGAQTYEELSCLRTMCGCYEISDREDPWCANDACRALASVARTVDVCGAPMRDAGVGPRDGGTTPRDMGTTPRDMGTTPRDSGSTADTGAIDAGGGGGDDDDDGCSAAPGSQRASLAGLVIALGVLGFAITRGRR